MSTTIPPQIVRLTGLGQFVDAYSSLYARWMQSVRVATTANVTLATGFDDGSTIDGVVVRTGDRVLARVQTTGAENGIVIVPASGAPVRAPDMPLGSDALGAMVLVTGGTANKGKLYRCDGLVPQEVGVAVLTFVEFAPQGVDDQGAFTFLDATQAAQPAAPASGKTRIYAKTDGLIYSQVNTNGVETLMSGGLRGLSRILAAVAIANTETVVTSYSMPAGFMAAGHTGTTVTGTTFRIKAYGRLTSGGTAGSSIFRIRIGGTTLTGNIPATLTIANNASVTNAPFVLDCDVTVRTAGSGTVIGNMSVQGGTSVVPFTVAGDISANATSVAVDTTSTRFIELTYTSGNAGTTATFENAVISVVYA